MKYEVDEKGQLKLLEKVGRWVSIIMWSLLLILVIEGIVFNTSLSKYGKITKGVVIEIDIGGKTSDTFDYEYYVNDRIFVGHTSLSNMPYKVQIGDTIEILYDSTNVNRSRPLDRKPW
jgi:hypothetical protein